MSDEKITLGIETTANTAGAEAAEEALRKVGEAAGEQTAAEKLAAASAEHQAEMLEKRAELEAELLPRIEDMKEATDELRKSTDEYAESTGAATDEASAMEQEVRDIARVQKAQALADYAQKVGEIGSKFKDAATEVRAFDKEAANALDATGDRIRNVTGAISTIATGFAVGGPLGAGVAALGVGLGALVDAFMDVEVAAIRAAAEERRALEEVAQAARDAAAATRERASEMKSEDVRNAIQLENDALAQQLGLLDESLRLAREKRAAQEEIAKAQDNLSLARIAEDEATEKITPEQAANQREGIERGAAGRGRDERKRRADEDAALAEDKRRAAEEDSRKKDIAAAEAAAEEDTARKLAEEKNREAAARQGLVDNMKKTLDAGRPTQQFVGSAGPGAAPRLSEEQIERMRLTKEAQDKYDLIKERLLPEAEAMLKDTLPEKTTASEAVTARESDTKLRMDEAEKARRAAAKATEEAQKAREKAEQTKEVVDTTGGMENAARDAQIRAQIFREERERKAREARDRIPGMEDELDRTAAANRDRILNSDKARNGPNAGMLQGIAKAIGEADTSGEINEISNQLKGMGGSTVAAMREFLAEQLRQAKEIDTLRQQIRNNRAR